VIDFDPDIPLTEYVIVPFELLENAKDSDPTARTLTREESKVGPKAGPVVS
jgi:hypothetical protein